MKRFLLIIVLLCVTSPAWSAWTHTNSKTGDSGASSVTSQAASAFTSALTNPSLIIVSCQQLSSTGVGSGAIEAFTVPTDTAGNTYLDVQVGLSYYDSQAIAFEMFYAENTHTTASNIVTCHTATGGVTHLTIRADEYTGGATSGPIDQKYYNPGQTGGASGANNLTTTSQTTTVNGDLIFAFFGCTSGPCSAGTSPNSFTSVSTVGGITESFVQTTAGAIAPTAGDTTSSDSYGAIWVAFTPSGTTAKSTTNFRNDLCTTADSTSLSNGWTLRHCQATTSDSLQATTANMTLTTNPVAGDLLVCQNGYFPETNMQITCSDSQANVASGNVTTTNPHTVTFSSGIPFDRAGCALGAGCRWVGQNLTLGVAGTCTVAAVASFTSLTCTQTISTNSTPQTYTGPTMSCTDSFQGGAVGLSTCMALVTNAGSDTVTVVPGGSAALNFDLNTTIIDVYATNGVLGLDTAACPVANCLGSDVTSNASTGVASKAITLSTTSELVLYSSCALLGPIGITAGWTAAVIGVTSATYSNPYCDGGYCINQVNDSLQSFASSGSQTASATDHTKNEAVTTSVFAFEPSTASGHCASCDLSELLWPWMNAPNGE